MLNMSEINNIRDLSQHGYSVSKIHEITGRDRKTISKYLEMDDFSPQPPQADKRPSILDPFKDTINEWIEQDKKNWYKQRHTAKRIFDRLVKEKGYTGSYPVVQRYIHEIKENVEKQKANQELIWEPGFAQADFGEADFLVRGQTARKKYLVLSFPHSNDSFCQIFGGETAECVCQGLQDIFYYIGGVPVTIVFDNATGVGKRIGDIIHESELFGKFRAHHRFSIRFCNPRSGWEKGNVEAKVKYDRLNLFVPIQEYEDIEKFNAGLLGQHEAKAAEVHYKKGKKISSLFEEDKAALAALPSKRFDVCRYEYLNADGYGKVCVGGCHYYSTRPENSGKRNILVGIRAHHIDIISPDGGVLVRHERQYGETRTDSSDYSTTVAMLSRHPGAWMNSGVRFDVSDALREYMDGLEKPALKDCLSMMKELSDEYGYHPAVQAMTMSIREGGINKSDAMVVASRVTGYGIDTPPSEGPELGEYDAAFLPGSPGNGEGGVGG